MKRNPHIDKAFFLSDKVIMSTIIIFVWELIFLKHPVVMTCILIYYTYAIMVHYYTIRITKAMQVLNENRRYRVFPGNEVVIGIGVRNNAKLSIPSGKLSFELNETIETEGVLIESGDGVLSDRRVYPFFIPAKDSIEWRLSIRPQKRGLYTMENVELIIYDWFRTSTIYFPVLPTLQTEILVYPLIKPIRNIQRLERLMPGSQQSRLSYLEDASAVSGVKQYENESFRHIHWKASLRMQQLVAKKYQPVTHNGVTICLNLSVSGRRFHSRFEDLISYTAFLCQYMTTKNLPFELFINMFKGGRPLALNLREGNEHLAASLTALAQLSTSGVPFSEIAFLTYINESQAPSVVTILVGGTGIRGNLQGEVVFVNEHGQLSGGGTDAALSI
ncbi:DUF58 domain-containing protein [Peribacillus sp. FSL H8-0477]|uniref:DUF58 domain-containing protein n=1 Tax=Peribacillus sp. FSL H8-0477 TaxID=2921388 RepID=UPI0030F50F85